MPSKKENVKKIDFVQKRNFKPLTVFMKKMKEGIFDRINYSSKKKCFVFIDSSKKEHRLKGLKPFLSNNFWPNFKMVKTKNPVKVIEKKLTEQQLLKIEKGRNIGREHNPVTRGTIVHDQISIYLQDNGKKKCLRDYGYIDIRTQIAEKFVTKNKLKHVVAELPIGLVGKGLGTAIDEILTDNQKNIYLIEWKSGNINYFEKGNDNMKNINVFIENSPLNQAYLQLAMNYIMFKALCPEIEPILYVVHLGDEPKPYNVPKKFIKIAKKIYKSM